MTDKAALLALADKLEKAAEPSRELDAEIGSILFDARPYDPSARTLWYFKKGTRTIAHIKLPDFTASIDAALTLVPSGFSGCVYFGEGPLQVANVNCHICGPDMNVSEDHTGVAPTSPLALCAAALRARAA